MARKFIKNDEAAAMLGVSEDDLNEMRLRGDIHAYRDGSSWKFRKEEVERVRLERGENDPSPIDLDDEPDSVLIDDLEVGGSDSSSSTIIGKSEGGSPATSESSDLDLGDLDFGDDSESELGLGSDLALGSAVGSQIKDLGTDDLTGSDLGLSDDLELVDGDTVLGKGSDSVEAGVIEDSGSSLELASDEEDVLGGLADSDITLQSGDSGISLASPSDSGLSLEEEPLELAGSDIGAFELGEDSSLELADDGDAPTEIKSDDDFLLTPLEEDEEEDSGSQVIALDEEEEFGLEGAMIGGDDVPVGALLEDDPLGDAGMMLQEDIGAPAPMMMPSESAAVVPEAPYSIWNVLSLALCLLMLVVCGWMMIEMIRNMWSWEQPSTSTSKLMQGVADMFK